MKKIFYILMMCGALMLVSCNDKTKNELSVSDKMSEKVTSQDMTTKKTATDTPIIEEATTEKIFEEEITKVTEIDDTYIYIPNGKTPQLLIDVLLSDAEFTFVQMDYPSTEKIAAWSKTLSTFNYEIDQFWDEPVEFGKYRVVDLDGDGYNEIIIDIPSTEALVLHYEDDEVYGFMYPWLGVKTISTSGVMEGAEGGSHTMYSVMKFNKDTYTDTTIAESDYIRKEGKFVYYVEDESVSLDEYTEYISSEKFTEKVPYWSDFETILTTK